MKRLIPTLMVLAVFTAYIACSSGSDDDGGDTGTGTTTATGGDVLLSVPGNPANESWYYPDALTVGGNLSVELIEASSAGYSWQFDNTDTATLDYITSRVIPPTGGIGGASTRYIDYTATNPGNCTLTMCYGQIWDPSTYAYIYIEVMVADNSSSP